MNKKNHPNIGSRLVINQVVKTKEPRSRHLRRILQPIFQLYSFLPIVAFLISSATQVAAQQTCASIPCIVEYRTANAELCKCQFGEFTNESLPRINMYRELTVTWDDFSTYTESGTNGGSDSGPCYTDFAGSGSWSELTEVNISATYSESYTGPYCNGSTNCSGSYSYESITTDGRVWNHTDSCGGCSYENGPSYASDIMSAYATNDPGQCSENWPPLAFVGTETISNYGAWSYGSGTGACTFSNGPTSSSSSDSWTQCQGFPGYNDVLSPILAQKDIVDGYSSDETNIFIYQLSDEYTDLQLSNNIMSIMPGFSGSWYVPNAESYDWFQTIAFSVIDGNHDKAWCWTHFPPSCNGCAELQQMQFICGIPNSVSNTQYEVDYDLVTCDLTTGDLSIESGSLTINGTGDTNNPATNDVPEYVAPPWWDESMTDCGGIVATWVQIISVSVVSANDAIGAGPGQLVACGSSGGSGCGNCGGAGMSGEKANLLGGMFARFSMGMSGPNVSAGSLQMSSSTPSTNLATPAGLSYLGNATNVAIIQAGNAIRQVDAPQGLVNVVTNSPFAYELRYYLPSQVGSLSGGVYEVTGSPFVTWTIANPAASTNTYNQLQITKTIASSVEVYNYTYGTSNWILDYPGSLREDQISWATTTNNVDVLGPSAIFTVTEEIRTPGGPDQYEAVRTYQLPLNENGSACMLVQKTMAPGSNPQTTTYAYEPDLLLPGNMPALARVVRPDGSWDWYNYTSTGQVWNHDTSFGDAPAPTPYADSGLGRYSIYSYAGTNFTDYPNVPMTVDTRVLGSMPVEYSLVTIENGERDDIRCAETGGGPGNLVTITKYFTNGPNMGQVASIQNPDGTMSFYSHVIGPDGSQTNIVWSGAPNTGLTAIVDGTESVAILGPVGQMISRAQTDIASGLTLANDVYGNYDSFSRPQQVTHLDGTSEQTYYSCCGVDETVDRDGVATYYYYDAANRRVAMSRNGIIITNVFDSVGRTLETIRIGTNGWQIVLGQWQYDAAGRLLAQTNALGGVTTYAESHDPPTGGLIRTTTNPDGSTIIEAYYLDGTLKKRTGTAVHGVRYTNGFDEYGEFAAFSAEIKLNSGGTDTFEAVTNFIDLLGRNYMTKYIDGSTSQSSYNGLGQLSVQVDADGVATSYAYNAKGEQTCIIRDPTNIARASYTFNDVTTDHSTSVRRTQTYVCFTNGSSSSNLISLSETSTDGLTSWQTNYRDAATPVSSESQTAYGSNRTLTTTSPDGSYNISVYTSGMLMSVTSFDSLANQIGKSTYNYDAYGRQSCTTDARNGATIYSYNNADLVASVTSPNPNSLGGSPQTTTTSYNNLSQATSVVQPDGTSVSMVYLSTGELAQTSGSRTYPVAYSYDYAGRMLTMTNWSSFSTGGGARVTTWNYSPYRGFLNSKTDAAGQAVSYSNTPAGRLLSRTWARGTNTAYGYDTAGDLISVTYNDGVTPSVTNSYDGVGRISSVVCGGATTSFGYDWANDVLSESYSGGILNDLSVSNQFDAYLRRTNVALYSGSSALCRGIYGYDHASRLASVSDGTNAASYSYLANSPLAGQIVFASNTVTRMTTTKQYDYLNRLSSIASSTLR